MRALFVILFLLGSIRGEAQYAFSANLTGNISVFSIQSLTMTGGTVIPSFNTFEDYQNGIEVSGYLNIAVKSNVSWTLSVMAQNAVFAPMTANGSTDMPASVLGIKTNSMANYLPSGTTAQTLKTGNKGDHNAPGNSFQVDLRYNPGFSYKGGIYTLGLVYTLTQQ